MKTKDKHEEVAIIGMSCRFPGGAINPDLYWNVLKNGKDVIEEIPKERWDNNSIYDSDTNALGHSYARHGGFLKDIDKFDNEFFRISPIEAESIDPQIRLLLELSYEAIEDAGIDLNQIKKTDTGVFIGISTIDYLKKSIRSYDKSFINSYSITGTLAASASGRISYAYDLAGPSISIDTACSSSLVALHQACKSLLSNETNLNIVGGVNLMLSPEYHVGFSRLGALSPDGHCKAFDASANGFVRSEGSAVLIIKKLSDAIRDKDNILGTIPGSCINNDGSEGGFTAPNPLAQEDVIRKALTLSGITINDVDYIETHGTGTKIGDPVELEAIGKVYADRDEDKNNLIIGSVKSIIGHTESAAGMAGLVKILLSMKHELIPPNAHFINPNPNINWNKIPVKVASKAIKWKQRDLPRIAGVSAFGLSGTNAHIIVKEPPHVQIAFDQKDDVITNPIILPLSARSKAALKDLAKIYLDIFEKSDYNEIYQIAKNVALRRTHFNNRLIIIGKSKSELIQKLNDHIIDGEEYLNRVKRKEVVFVFPGQGSQWLGMGLELLEASPVFKELMLNCEKELKKHVSWSLIDELKSGAKFKDVSVIQPILFAIQISLSKLWMSFGIHPKLVIGHSMGEVAAAYVSEILTLKDAVKVICLRSRLAKKISGKGAMAVVELSIEKISAVIKDYKKEVSIAANNGPNSVILSGDSASIDVIIEKLERENVFCRKINVDFASHSPQIDTIKKELLDGLGKITPKKGVIPIYSTVKNELSDGNDFNEYYWCDNIRKPVLFSQAIQYCLENTEELTFVEISPHPVLLAFVEQNIENNIKGKIDIFQNHNSYTTTRSLKREEPELYEVLSNLCELYSDGVDVNWKSYYSSDYCNKKTLKIPMYPWQREMFWIEDSDNFNIQGNTGKQHPFLSNYIKYISKDDVHIWTFPIDFNSTPFLKDHIVKDAILYPASGFIELLSSSVNYIKKSKTYTIRGLIFDQPLILKEGTSKTIQVSISIENNNAHFKIISIVNENNQEDIPIVHVYGAFVFEDENKELLTQTLKQLKTYSSIGQVISKEEHYESCDGMGLHYGKSFQFVEKIYIDDKIIIGEIIPDDEIMINNFEVHPALLDSCFQIALHSVNKDDGTVVPSQIKEVIIKKDFFFKERLIVTCENLPSDSSEYFLRDLKIYNEKGECLLICKEFKLNKLNKESKEELIDCLFIPEWEPQKITTKFSESTSQNDHYLILADKDKRGLSLIKCLQKNKIKYTLISKGNEFIKKSKGQEIEYTVDPLNPKDIENVLQDLNWKDRMAPNKIIYFWGANQLINNETPLSLENDFSCLSVTYLLQELSKIDKKATLQLYIFTSGSQKVISKDSQINLLQVPLWGIGRTIFHEFLEYRCTRIDLSFDFSEKELEQAFYATLNKQNETEIAIRGGRTYIARLEKLVNSKKVNLNDEIEKVLVTKDTAYEVTIQDPGIIENLIVQQVDREELNKGEIEIEVKAVGLNFINLMSALGIYPGYERGFRSLGIEFSGVVTRVDSSIKKHQIGDQVFGCGERCLRKYIKVSSDLIIKKPKGLTHEEAATIPIVFLTAYYSLIIKGQLKKDEVVLIHSASGGVGQAAIQIAKSVGARIFGTAGTEEKREFLRSMGVELVMDSRSLEFSNTIKKYTNNKGVDVVLNSLINDAMIQSIKLLKPFGRFLEIGKKDIYDNNNLGLEVFKNSISYHFIDLDKIMKDRPQEIQILLNEICFNLKEGSYRPIKKTIFPISQVASGFEYMAKGHHMGKIVFSLGEKDLWIVPDKNKKQIFNDKDAFLIAGGLGGLGLELTKWLAKKGLKNIFLISRKGMSYSIPIIEDLKSKKIKITVLKGDISDYKQMKSIFEEVSKAGVTLTGIVNAAGVLDDSSIGNLNKEKFNNVIRSKIHGSWNLHLLSKNENIKWFMLYSSVASFLGSPGQANYVAGNSFVDGLYDYRSLHKLPVQIINWGPIAEIGLAVKQENRGGRLESEGIKSFSIEEYIDVLDILIHQGVDRFAAMRFNSDQWIKYNPSYSEESLFNRIVNKKDKALNEEVAIKNKFFTAASFDESVELLKEVLKDSLYQTLKITKSKIDVEAPFVNLGMDSLMAIQLRNRLERNLGILISVTIFWNYPSINLLTEYLTGELGIKEHYLNSSETDQPDEVLYNIDDLSLGEITSELDEELKDIL